MEKGREGHEAAPEPNHVRAQARTCTPRDIVSSRKGDGEAEYLNLHTGMRRVQPTNGDHSTIGPPRPIETTKGIAPSRHQGPRGALTTNMAGSWPTHLRTRCFSRKHPTCRPRHGHRSICCQILHTNTRLCSWGHARPARPRTPHTNVLSTSTHSVAYLDCLLAATSASTTL